MKKIIVFAFTWLCLSFSQAQAPGYDDLLILFADGNYPKLIRVSEKYTGKEDTKNDPAPYFWMAKGLYKISFDNSRDEVFKNAFKESLNVLGTCRKKDKDTSFYTENIEFFMEVKASLIEAIENDISAKDYRKAAGWVTRVYKITPNDVGGKYLEAACKFRNADKGGANTTWKEATKLLDAMTGVDGMTEEDLKMFKLGIFETAECYLAMKQVDKARALINKVAPWFDEDEDFTERASTFN